VEYLDNKDNDALWDVLAHPADVKYAYTIDVQSLVNEFPQSGILRALLAGNGEAQNVKKAVTYFDPATLYKIVNTPDSLPVVTSAQIAGIDKPLSVRETSLANTNTDLPIAEIETTHVAAAEEESAKEDTTTAVETAYDPFANIAEVDQNVGKAEAQDHILTEENDADTGAAHLTEAYKEVEGTESEPVPEYEDKTEYFHQDIEDEIYDEIVSIEDISLEQLAVYQTETAGSDINDSESKITATDHFVFDGGFTKNEGIAGIPAENAPPDINENHEVSKYNDEKLPYTFMWWLDKTRREHAAIYQPYVYNNAGTKNIGTTPAAQKKPA